MLEGLRKLQKIHELEISVYPGQHGIALFERAVRSAGRQGVGRSNGRRSARIVPVRKGRGAADAAARRRPHHQFF